MDVNPYDKIKATISVVFLSLAAAVALTVAFTMFFIGIPEEKSRLKLCQDKMEVLRNAPETEDNSYEIKSLQFDIEFYETQTGKHYITSLITFLIGTFGTWGSVRGYKMVLSIWRGSGRGVKE